MIESGDGATSAGIRVLICDDAPAMRSLLGVVIGLREGMTVVGEAGDGDEAIEQAEVLQPDVILLDLAMPRRTGLEALPEINRVAPASKVVILSGFAESIIDGDVVAHGMASYLQKGVEPDDILAAIEAAAAG
jgi:DNA-binding NarL/FixJ family response regulator